MEVYSSLSTYTIVDLQQILTQSPDLKIKEYLIPTIKSQSPNFSLWNIVQRGENAV